MTEHDIRISILLSAQRALLGAITPNIRLITIGWEGLKTLTLRAYYDSPPNEDDIEEMEVVTTEIFSDIPDFEKVYPVETIFDTRPRSELEILKVIVYSRKEQTTLIIHGMVSG